MSAPENKTAIDVEFIKPFISATKSVMETMASTKPVMGKVYLLDLADKVPADIIGVIDLLTAEFRGTIAVCFRTDVFLKIYEKLTGEVHPSITPEIQDAAAEIVNMIYGQAKQTLNSTKGYALPTQLPKIVLGAKIGTHRLSSTPAVVLPFDSPVGAFHLEIVIDKV